MLLSVDSVSDLHILQINNFKECDFKPPTGRSINFVRYTVYVINKPIIATRQMRESNRKVHEILEHSKLWK